MNKETIYVDSTDDITDVLTKIKSSEKKIIALVPPKKPTIFLSSINIKLLARTARAEKKALVLVTTDDSLTRLAMAASLPVASSLKSRPVMPEKSADSSASLKSEPASGEAAPEPKPSPKASETPKRPSLDDVDPETLLNDDESDSDDSDETDADDLKTSSSSDETSDSDEPSDSPATKKSSLEKVKKRSEKPKKEKPEKEKSGNPFIAFLNKKKSWVVFGTVATSAVIVFFVWALMIAPKLGLVVKVRTSSGNFSENVSFVTDVMKENKGEGVFSVHEEKLEKSQEIKFTATGQKDLGEPASGSLTVYYQDTKAFSFNFSEGSVFTYKGLEYVATASKTLSWDGEDDSICGSSSSFSKGCLTSVVVSVKASAPGENYNVSGRQSGWASRDFPEISVYNESDLTGGTSKVVTIVQQSDIDLALDKLKNETKESGKTELFGKISDTALVLGDSFKVDAAEPKVSPAAGEEVPEGTTPSISSKTTYSVLTVDRTHVENFITDKANLEEGRKIYSVGEPFVEYFAETESGVYGGKLKTTYKFGPKISETEILEKIDGQKVGRIEPILRDEFPGIASVSLEKSVFWVNRVPKNPNRVTIKLEVEE